MIFFNKFATRVSNPIKKSIDYFNYLMLKIRNFKSVYKTRVHSFQILIISKLMNNMGI